MASKSAPVRVETNMIGIDYVKKTGRALAILAAVAGTLSLTTPGAYARDWHGGGWGGYHRHDGGAVALGILGGALAGAAIAGATNPYYYNYSYPYNYAYPYAYSYPYYGGGYGSYPYYYGY
jgi:hypothetical protein